MSLPVVQSQPMLETQQLACQRGDRLLFRKLDLSVAPGQLLRVAGANGLGKTSLLRLLAGLAHPASGSVSWYSAPIAKQREAYHAGLLYLGHAPALNDLLTPLENLRFACRSAGEVIEDAACEAALRRIGLGRQLDLPARVLSQGQRRRVGLARLFLEVRRPLWILDEPFTALDVDAVRDLAIHIDLHCDTGGMVVFTSHQEVAFRTQVAELDLIEVAR